ncbi:MAG: hypothetical protein COA79_11610 [Planctomycetota bacterium]|nr:MAG: hypothetical protein COA79_11610 [Planctomycetota bacterium]
MSSRKLKNTTEYNYRENEELENDMEFEQEWDEVENSNNNRNQGMFVWLISILVHAVIIGILTLFLIHQKEEPKDVVITTTMIEEITEEEEEKVEIEVEKQIVEIENPEIVETPIVTEEEVVEEINETENEMESESAEGISEAISDMPLVGQGIMGNIGGGGGGAFGQRTGGDKKRAVMRNGGSRKTESAVNLGLEWLAKHQEPHGGWESAKYDGDGKEETDFGCSGLALLAFLGAGHTNRVGKYKVHVNRAIHSLIKKQKGNGSWDRVNYANGICAMALAEAHGMGCSNKGLKAATEKAIDYILSQKNDYGGYWYVEVQKGQKTQTDMSLSGWCIMALKSAMLSGIREKDIKANFVEFGEFMDKQKETTGDNTSTTKGDSWYQVNGDKVKKSVASTACAAVAMLMRQYLGWHRSEPWLEASSNGLIKRIPKYWIAMDVYKVYYAYLSLFQQGGENWKVWNKQVTKIIISGQRQDGDFKGSWDNNSHMIKRAGRVLTTAMLCLSLEIYYRYKSVMKE